MTKPDFEKDGESGVTVTRPDPKEMRQIKTYIDKHYDVIIEKKSPREYDFYFRDSKTFKKAASDILDIINGDIECN